MAIQTLLQRLDTAYSVARSIVPQNGSGTDIRDICNNISEFDTVLTSLGMELRQDGLTTFEIDSGESKRCKKNGSNWEWEIVPTTTEVLKMIQDEIAKIPPGGSGEGHTHSNKTELDKIATGDKAKWDGYQSQLEETEAKIDNHIQNHPGGDSGVVSKTFEMCETPIPLPTTKECDGQVTHPSIVAVPPHLYGTFSGAKYILAVTPLPYYKVSLENPTIFGTNNHKEFFNLSNGFIDTPKQDNNRTYLSDPCLVFVGDTLECWYREADELNNTETIYRMKSTNGKTWTDKETLLSSTNDLKKHLSPAVIYEGGIYKIWTNSNGKINYYTSQTGADWQFVKQFTYENWHFSVKHTSKGYEVVNCSADNNFHYGVFQNEVDWDRSKTSIIIRKGGIGNIGDNGLYHGSMVIDSDNRYYVYFGANSIDNRWNTCLMTGFYNEGTLNLIPVNFFDNKKNLYATDTVNTKKVNTDGISIGNSIYDENSIRLYSSKGTVRVYNNNFMVETDNIFRAKQYKLDASTEILKINGEGYWSISDKAIQTTRSGQTSARPANPNVGLMYFDTTLGYPIWWKGSEWVKFDGTSAGGGSSSIPVTGVTLNKTTTTINVNSTDTLTATVAPINATNKSVTWASSNTSIATVSNGIVTGKANGSCTVTCTTSDGNKTATCDVTVQTQNIAVTGVTLNKNILSISIGRTEQLTATVAPSNATNKSVSWTSSDNTKATVSSTGLITAIALGSTTITCTTQDGNKVATCDITVTEASFPNAITLPYSIPTEAGCSYDDSLKMLELTSSNKYITFALRYNNVLAKGGQYAIKCKVVERNLNTGHSLKFQSTWGVTGATMQTNLSTCELNTIHSQVVTIQETASETAGNNVCSISFDSAEATNSSIKILIWIEQV